ncbi:alpha/beta hydrolase [Lapidilactobacillus luobeiensis]|uniref:alpha/beta hydrolase n=1 Tax=Lapidilactobacillus luobeiensis TaxID=2950371 RepID=UPI0021C2FAB9|nr:alpha/beta fold hydrolase [Lapidilactobacillus luobeiensis]
MALINLCRNSTILESQTNVQIVLPDSLIGQDDLKVIWLLHGLGDNGTGWQRKTTIEQFALAAHCAVVMPAMGRSFYQNMVWGQRYWDYLTKELIPEMRELLPLSSKFEDNYLVGNSMGGYGALKLAFCHPTTFSAVAVLSAVADLKVVPSIMADHEAVFGAKDERLEQEQLTVWAQRADPKALARIRWWQAIGQSDFMYQDNQKLHTFLTTQLDLKVTYHVSPGEHDWDYWNQQLPLVFNWLFADQKGKINNETNNRGTQRIDDAH